LSLKNKGYTKKTTTYKTLGCTYEFFASWLGIDNYFKDSHIDHVVPISLANTEKEVLLLNHYSNFQILTKKENLKKGNRYINNTNLQRVLNNHPKKECIHKIINKSNIKII
jgi:5-methylcytosine-specific restriction endonuclease McrA